MLPRICNEQEHFRKVKMLHPKEGGLLDPVHGRSAGREFATTPSLSPLLLESISLHVPARASVTEVMCGPGTVQIT